MENRTDRIESIKRTLEFGKRAIFESKDWTENAAGGWEIIARTTMDLAQELLKILEEEENA